MSLALPSAPIKAFSLFSISTRSLQPYLSRPTWSLPCEASSSSSATLADAPRPWYSALVPALESLAELFPPILLAVPKSKISHSRKSMRSANKGLKNKSNFSHCSACGSIKLSHNICPSCYSQISRRWKAENRAGQSPLQEGSSSTSQGSSSI